MRVLAGDYTRSTRLAVAEPEPASEATWRAWIPHALPNGAVVTVGDGSLKGRCYGVHTQAPAFKAWFGDSKIVDPSGQPVVLYYPTHGPDFTAFRLGLRPALFCTGWPSHASGIADGVVGVVSPTAGPVYVGSSEKHFGQRIVPVFARLERPFYYPEAKDDYERWATEAYAVTRRHWFQACLGGGMPPLDDLNHEATAILRARQVAHFHELQSAGHDGMIHEKSWGPRFFFMVAVFDPRQLKSAIGNRGTFDLTSANICD